MLAALIGVILCIAVSMILKETRMSLMDIIDGLAEGARSALPVVVSCATAGIIVGIITLTGLGMKMSGGLVKLAGGNLYLTMVLTMIGSLILGMGVPTTANYIIQATVSAPALVSLGVHPLAAHLFVFYFGIVADITPPVALAAFAGAGIAKPTLQTGVEALLGFAAYLIPYICTFANSDSGKAGRHQLLFILRILLHWQRLLSAWYVLECQRQTILLQMISGMKGLCCWAVSY